MPTLRARRESLQARATRKLSRETLNKLPSPVVFEAEREIEKTLAENLQRAVRKKKFRIKRQGSKMTTYEMRRQLCDYWCNIDPDQTFDEFVMEVLHPAIENINNSGEVSEDIKILLNNLSRPLLEHLYNKLDYGDSPSKEKLENRSEDIRYINNPLFFQQDHSHGGKKYRKTKKSKKIKLKTKNIEKID